jgi:GntR family transcriptional regulator
VIVRIDPEAPVPPYEQLRSQVAALIASGALPADHLLPPIRQLAKDLGLAAGTVARAYRELEAVGLVRSQGRRGTRVLAQEHRPGVTEGATELASAARRFADEVAPLEVDTEAVVLAVRAALATVPVQSRD